MESSTILPAVKHLLATGPVVLFFDGHFSCMSVSLIKNKHTLGIYLFCLPPNITHVLQPLDVGVFGLVKQWWRTILKNHKLKIKATNITKEVFPSLIKQLWERGITAKHLQGSFRAAGLVPFNPKAMKPFQLAPSMVISRTKHWGRVHCHTDTAPLWNANVCWAPWLFSWSIEASWGAAETKRHHRVEVSCIGK